MASIKCGRCGKYHESVADVRKCFNGEQVSFTQPEAQNDGPPLTTKQVGYISSLLNQLHAQYTGDTPIEALARYGAGRELLDALVRARNEDAHGRSYTLPAGVSVLPRGRKSATPSAELPDVPVGHYAVPSLTGNNDLDFFRVDRPTEGDWKGKTFVKRVIGGKPDANVRGRTRREALEAIVAAGIDKSAVLYGQEIGQCYRCNRHLTEATSRQLGIGPDCRSKGA